MNTFRHYLFYWKENSIVWFDLIEQDVRELIEVIPPESQDTDFMKLKKTSRKINSILMDEHSHYLTVIYKNNIQIFGETFQLKDAVLTSFKEGLTINSEDQSEYSDFIMTNDSQLIVYDHSLSIKKEIEISLKFIALSPDQKYLAGFNS